MPQNRLRNTEWHHSEPVKELNRLIVSIHGDILLPIGKKPWSPTIYLNIYLNIMVVWCSVLYHDMIILQVKCNGN